MQNNKSSLISTIDKLIFGFSIMFLLSLDISIFVNQLGYYGALLLLLIRYAVSKENKFKKTGIELAFVLFLLAEVISAIFSINQPLAFQNAFKRALLIPTCYTLIAATDDLKKAKLFFKVYIGAALVGVLLYLGVAWQYFIAQLYRIEGKGPSLFQYVMTVGGLMSFTVIFTYAFLLNEKGKLSMRLFYLAGFLLSLIALAASDTRAAWIGAAAGIVFITIIKRKWFIILPIVVLIAAFLIIQKNKSNLYVYDYDNGKFSLENKTSMPGRPNMLYAQKDTLIIADFEVGLLTLKDNKVIASVKTPAPVSDILYLEKSYYSVFLIDQRIGIYKKDTSGNLTPKNEIIPQGVVAALAGCKGHLYIPLENGNLTVYPDPVNSKEFRSFPEFNSVVHMSVDSNYLAAFDKKNKLEVWKLKDGMPDRRIFSRIFNTNYGFVSLIDNHLFFNTEKELLLFRVDAESVSLAGRKTDLSNSFIYRISQNRLFAFDSKGAVRELEYPVKNGNPVIKHLSQLGFNPSGISISENVFYITEVQRNRITSLIDPFHPSNLQRIYQWQAGFRILKDHLLFGVGDIDMHPVYQQYKNYYETETFGHLHNDYIHFLAILGLVGFAAAMYLFYSIYMVNRKIYHSLKGIKFASSYSLGAWAGFVGFMVSGLGEWNFGDHEIITMVWFMLGLNIAFYYNVTNKKSIAEKDLVKEGLPE